MPDPWELETDDEVLFWGGVLSNWHACDFTARICPDGKRFTFNCAEQYMMVAKAALFEDPETMFDIMCSDDPREQKALGRTVRNYIDFAWLSVARDRVYVGAYEKFRQNAGLLKLLLGTRDKLIVEASPHDNRWGIGFGVKTALQTREHWGHNWLGQVLMKVRDDIRSSQDSSFTHIDWTAYERKCIA